GRGACGRGRQERSRLAALPARDPGAPPRRGRDRAAPRRRERAAPPPCRPYLSVLNANTTRSPGRPFRRKTIALSVTSATSPAMTRTLPASRLPVVPSSRSEEHTSELQSRVDI